MDKVRKRHIRVYKFFRVIMRPILRLLFNYSYGTVPQLDGPCLILANHNLNWDPLLIGIAFKKQMYFVASEHTFHWGLVSRFLCRYFAPIARMKGTIDSVAALNILRTLRQGSNVCIFAEGDRSWNGRTGPVHASLGKLALRAGATLITYKFTGGYLTSPRWSTRLRRGRMTGQVVGVYTPEQLRALSADEILSVVGRDLREDAYARQGEEMIPYKGKYPAEKLETALFICPQCGGIGTLKSEDDRFFCACGLSMHYDRYGYFSGDGLPFKNVAEWDDWQHERAAEFAERPDSGPVFSDDGAELYRTEHSHIQTKVAQGRLSLASGTLTIGECSFPLSDINKMSMFGRQGLVFTSGGGYFEIKSQRTFCARKYLILWNMRHKGELLQESAR